ncbi:MAG: hypothetical protein JWO36_6691 [Myxococcales bacterium]|nr:hypothetical protein [Myxococcales bacterium]
MLQVGDGRTRLKSREHGLARLPLRTVVLRQDLSTHRRNFPTGKKVSEKEMRALNIERDEFHGDWNYVIRPREKAP